MSEPVVILGQLREATERLGEASKEVYRQQTQVDDLEALFVKSQEKYDDLYSSLLVVLKEEYEAKDKRLPGEDVRNAVITEQMRERNPELVGQHRKLDQELQDLKRELKRTRDLADFIERSIFSYQSQLSWHKTEAQAIG